jgi:hypothetical protein
MTDDTDPQRDEFEREDTPVDLVARLRFLTPDPAPPGHPYPLVEPEGEDAPYFGWWAEMDSIDAIRAMWAAADEIERLRAERRAFSLVLPQVGSQWWWEPEKPHARCLVEVIEVEFNGDEWIVWCIEPTQSSADRCWNELPRWVEATVLHRTAEATPTDDDHTA